MDLTKDKSPLSLITSVSSKLPWLYSKIKCFMYRLLSLPIETFLSGVMTRPVTLQRCLLDVNTVLVGLMRIRPSKSSTKSFWTKGSTSDKTLGLLVEKVRSSAYREKVMLLWRQKDCNLLSKDIRQKFDIAGEEGAPTLSTKFDL